MILVNFGVKNPNLNVIQSDDFCASEIAGSKPPKPAKICKIPRKEIVDLRITAQRGGSIKS